MARYFFGGGGGGRELVTLINLSSDKVRGLGSGGGRVGGGGVGLFCLSDTRILRGGFDGHVLGSLPSTTMLVRAVALIPLGGSA